MAAPAGTILLQSPYIILTGTQSGQGITVVTMGFQLGIIEQIWVGSHRQLGDIVLFPLEGKIIINDGASDFFMIDESKIIYQEPPPL